MVETIESTHEAKSKGIRIALKSTLCNHALDESSTLLMNSTHTRPGCRLRLPLVIAAMLGICSVGPAQTSVTNSADGIPNSIPKYSNSSTLVNSGIAEANGNVGIDTANPASTLHIVSPDVPLATNGRPFGNGNVVIQGTDSARSTSAGAALVFVVPANSDGSNPWEQGRIIVTPDSNDNGDAAGRMYLQTRFPINGGWDWRNNVVLTSNGNVGVGTATPSSLLSVGSASQFQVDSLGGVNANGLTVNTLTVNGNANITGTSVFNNPLVQFIPAALGSSVGSTTQLLTLGQPTGNYNSLTTSEIRNTAGADWTSVTTRMQERVDSTLMGYIDFNPTNGNFGLALGSGTTEYVRIANGGNVGIGTATPGSDLAGLPSPPSPATPILEVNGDIALTQGKGGSIIFQDGTSQTTAYTGTCVATGGDYAESVDVMGDKAAYEPGDVIVIDSANPERFLKSSQPYSTLVAGIYSTKPGYVGRRQGSTPKLVNSEIPMAMIGIVPTKVTTENGPIKAGDLLVTSSVSGYAMKGTDRNAMNGAIVGKALKNFKSGNGVIEVLVTLQ